MPGNSKIWKIVVHIDFQQIHETIVTSGMFKPGQTVAIGSSGGKDSTVLAYVLFVLNRRYNYGLRFVLLSVDEGIQVLIIWKVFASLLKH